MPTTLDSSALATITVTFNPDIHLLESQLRALPEECVKIIVDNASVPALLAQVEALVQELKNAYLLRNPSNLGLATALNRGATKAAELEPKPRFVLLLDQDSEPQPGSIEVLMVAFERLEKAGHAVGCVGPLLQDATTGLSHGFHQCTRWRWRRIYPVTGTSIPVACANLNGSGTLVPLALLMRLDGLEDDFFIDHVDTEWAFRVLANGCSLWGIPAAVFVHRMGGASLRFWWFGWRVWPSRSPQRHYYLVRNAVRLMRRGYVPRVWKVWACLKLIMIFFLHVLFDSRRHMQAKKIIAGFREGLSGRE